MYYNVFCHPLAKIMVKNELLNTKVKLKVASILNQSLQGKAERATISI